MLGRYLVHAEQTTSSQSGSTLYNYYIRERGAHEGEYLARVYDPQLADRIVDLLNRYGTPRPSTAQQQKLL